MSHGYYVPPQMQPWPPQQYVYQTPLPPHQFLMMPQAAQQPYAPAAPQPPPHQTHYFTTYNNNTMVPAPHAPPPHAAHEVHHYYHYGVLPWGQHHAGVPPPTHAGVPPWYPPAPPAPPAGPAAHASPPSPPARGDTHAAWMQILFELLMHRSLRQDYDDKEEVAQRTAPRRRRRSSSSRRASIQTETVPPPPPPPPPPPLSAISPMKHVNVQTEEVEEGESNPT